MFSRYSMKITGDLAPKGEKSKIQFPPEHIYYQSITPNFAEFRSGNNRRGAARKAGAPWRAWSAECRVWSREAECGDAGGSGGEKGQRYPQDPHPSRGGTLRRGGGSEGWLRVNGCDGVLAELAEI